MPLLFLHGGGVSGWMWDKHIRHFTHYHCVVPDLPEQGLSTDGTKFSIKSSAEKLIDLIEEIAKEKKVIVIGFSLGAQITIQMLSMSPDLIDYAIINSALDLVHSNSNCTGLIIPHIGHRVSLANPDYFNRMIEE
jgi:pimeloyl-ACP methyl ester carboxylesterase